MEELEAVEHPLVPAVRNPRFGLVVKTERAICREERFVVRLRGWLQDRINSAPVFTCAECGTPVSLRSSIRRRWFFRHQDDGPKDCPYRERGAREIQDIDAYRYNGQKEGRLHREMKRLIIESLAADKQFTDVKVEQRWNGTYDTTTWRKPDIQAKCRETRIAFEMQPSATYVSVIRARRQFYLQEGGLLFWIFPGLNPELLRLYHEDVFFNNNSNIFVVNKETLESSRRSGLLTLQCHYCAPRLEGEKIIDEWKSQIVSIADLKINRARQEVYFFDYRSERNKIQQKSAADRTEALRSSLENFWLQYGAEAAAEVQEEYEPIRDALKAAGLSVPDWHSDQPFCSLVSMLLSAKHGRPVGYRHSKLLEVAHTAYQHHKPLLLPFGWVSQLHGTDKIIEAQDRKKIWAKRRVAIQNAIRLRDSEFKPDIRFAPLVDFLFPGLGVKWTEWHKKWSAV